MLNVLVENAALTGTISSTTAVHVDLEGNVLPNGTVLNAYMGSEEFGHCNYAAEQGGMGTDAKMIGRFCHTVKPVLNNPINVTLSNAKWNVTGDGYIQNLTVDQLADLSATTAVTVTVKSMTVAGEAYADGTYAEGNVTIVVDSTEVEVVDNGVADAGQTYGNVVYTFMVETEAGDKNSKAVKVKRQNYIDGNIYFKLIPEEGFEVVSFSGNGGTITENTEGGELAAYEYVLKPAEGAKEMGVTIIVK